MNTRAMSRRLRSLQQRTRADRAPGVVLIDPTEEEVRAALARGLHVVALPHNHRELKPCAQP